MQPHVSTGVTPELLFFVPSVLLCNVDVGSLSLSLQ